MRQIGIFTKAVQHQIFEYEKLNNKAPRYLVLSPEKLNLLKRENEPQYFDIKIDPYTRKKKSEFMGVEIVELKFIFNGSCSWALGE